MSGVELPKHFESAHSVPKLFKSLHFVTSLLIAYDGRPGAHLRRLDCLNIKTWSHAQRQMVYKRKTTRNYLL